MLKSFIALWSLYKETKMELEVLRLQYKKHIDTSISWSEYDFLSYEGDYEITYNQATLALKDMISHHDASYGITWETVEFYIQKYGNLKQK